MFGKSLRVKELNIFVGCMLPIALSSSINVERVGRDF